MMNNKRYLLFIPSVGRYTSYESIEELTLARDKMLQFELERLKINFSILEETIYPNGDTETRPLRDNKERKNKEINLEAGHDMDILHDYHPLSKKVVII